MIWAIIDRRRSSRRGRAHLFVSVFMVAVVVVVKVVVESPPSDPRPISRFARWRPRKARFVLRPSGDTKRRRGGNNNRRGHNNNNSHESLVQDPVLGPTEKAADCNCVSACVCWRVCR